MLQKISCCILFYVFFNPAFAQLTITSALCESKLNPLGVDVQNLHFSWIATAAENNQYQTAYQTVIAHSKEKIAAADYDVYNSAMVKTKQSVLVKYSGKPLMPATSYYWKVRLWDKNNKVSNWSETQTITTGLFTQNDWNGAEWLGYEQLPDSLRVVPGIHQPDAETLGNKAMQRAVIPLFRKNFTTTKKIESALLFITGLGQYEVSINGNKIGNSFLAPGWTYYDKTILYNTYDVTNNVQQGQNAIAAIVGNGFYNINRERYFKIVDAFGYPSFLCCLKIRYNDGMEENIVTDKSWKTTASPITFSSIYGGEDYDAQLEQQGWNTTYFDDANWKTALQIKPPPGKLIPEQEYPVMIMDSFLPKRIIRPKPGICLYDFGQNAAGVVALKIKGHKGQTVKLTPGELLNKEQLVNQYASGNPYYFTYTLKSDEEETWQPQFTYYGFRYVQVEGAAPSMAASDSSLPKILQLTLLHTRNSNPDVGSFECSNPLFNRIDTLIKWAIKSNMQSIITDCPHREKLSWLEQDYLMGNSIHYNYDIYHLYKQLVYDLMDAQYPQGFVPDIAPVFVVFGGGFLDSPEWGSSAVILPWLLYTWYGDKDLLQQAYPMIKKYVDYLKTKANNNILTHGLGDWYDYGPNPPGEAQLTPKAVTATSIYYYDAQLLSQIAAVLHHQPDAANYSRLASAIKKSFNKRFFNPATNVYATGSQTSMAMPLAVGLVNDGVKGAVLQNLVDSIYANNKALTAGDIGFHFLIKALDDGGKSQLIYDMNNRDDVAGYGYQLNKGATALTESWAALEEVSNNHLMLGHIMEWFYSGLAGIGQEEGSVGYQHIRIRPQPVGDITYAKGSFQSPYGLISTDWNKENDGFELKVHIPVNTTANIYLPANAKSSVYMNGKLWSNNMQKKNETALIMVGSGDYQFAVK